MFTVLFVHRFRKGSRNAPSAATMSTESRKSVRVLVLMEEDVFTQTILSQAERVEGGHRLQSLHQPLEALLLVAPLLQEAAVIKAQL